MKFTGKVEFFETGVAKLMPLSGVVISCKPRGNNDAEIVKVINVTVKKHRYYLEPGMQREHRRVTVRGQEINDVPTKYTMTGLESYEIPVVGELDMLLIFLFSSSHKFLKPYFSYLLYKYSYFLTNMNVMQFISTYILQLIFIYFFYIQKNYFNFVY